jgi:hypothetical protein
MKSDWKPKLEIEWASQPARPLDIAFYRTQPRDRATYGAANNTVTSPRASAIHPIALEVFIHRLFVGFLAAKITLASAIKAPVRASRRITTSSSGYLSIPPRNSRYAIGIHQRRKAPVAANIALKAFLLGWPPRNPEKTHAPMRQANKTRRIVMDFSFQNTCSGVPDTLVPFTQFSSQSRC